MKDFHSFAYIGPLMLILFTVICQIKTPGYDPTSQYISELAASQTLCEEAMNYLAILPFGGSIVLFSLYLFRYFGRSFSHQIGYILLFHTGLLFLAGGIFHPETTASFDVMSCESVIHYYSIFIAVGLAIIIQLYFGLHLVSKRYWKGFYFISLATGLISTGLVVYMNNIQYVSQYKGFFQRGFILLFCIWLILSGIFMRTAEISTRGK
jgi:hypothetical protein